MKIREQGGFYFRFETLTSGRKESKWYGTSVSGETCAEIIYLAEFNKVLCSDIAEYMVRDVISRKAKPEIVTVGKDGLDVNFNFTLDLAEMLEVYSITNGVPERALVRACLIYWNEHLGREYDAV